MQLINQFINQFSNSSIFHLYMERCTEMKLNAPLWIQNRVFWVLYTFRYREPSKPLFHPNRRPWFISAQRSTPSTLHLRKSSQNWRTHIYLCLRYRHPRGPQPLRVDGHLMQRYMDIWLTHGYVDIWIYEQLGALRALLHGISVCQTL